MNSNQRGWRERAACRDVDPETFFPTAESGPERDRQVATAKAVCARCPVRAECLGEALARIPYGVAGGLTEHERRTLRRSTTVSQPAAEDVLRDGPRPGATGQEAARERAQAGRDLLATGRTARQIAQDCGVSTRTVQRWARPSTQLTAIPTADAGEGSHGGNRAPLQVSTAHDSQAGTRTPEGI